MRYPYVEIAVSIGGWSAVGEALPDTGYNGTVIIPSGCIDDIDAPFERGHIYLADRRDVRVNTWEGEVDLGGKTFTIQIHALEMSSSSGERCWTS
jgi:predicted aspartyl protease